MQVHLGSTQGGPEFRAFNNPLEGEEGGGSKGRGVGGVRGGTPPPPTVYGRSNTSLGGGFHENRRPCLTPPPPDRNAKRKRFWGRRADEGEAKVEVETLEVRRC